MDGYTYRSSRGEIVPTQEKTKALNSCLYTNQIRSSKVSEYTLFTTTSVSCRTATFTPRPGRRICRTSSHMHLWKLQLHARNPKGRPS